MKERRRSVRYRTGSAAVVVLERDGVPREVEIADISPAGVMLLLHDSIDWRVPVGKEIAFELKRPQGNFRAAGRVVHATPVRRGMGIGIEMGREDKALEACGALCAAPEAGGFRLQAGAAGATLHVVGRLSFSTSRDCLALIRRGAISAIDLSACTSIDSSGLGTLCIARDSGVFVGGSRGQIRRMLEVARIEESGA